MIWLGTERQLFFFKFCLRNSQILSLQSCWASLTREMLFKDIGHIRTPQSCESKSLLLWKSKYIKRNIYFFGLDLELDNRYKWAIVLAERMKEEEQGEGNVHVRAAAWSSIIRRFNSIQLTIYLRISKNI